MLMDFKHISVLLEESVESLNIKPDGIYVDCTAGGGGHSAAILSHIGENGRMILIDQDPDAISVVTKRFEGDKRVTIVHNNFSNFANILSDLGVEKVDGIVADLGVSSHQLDTAERGFSFHHDALLDMRMSQKGKSAADIVNTYSKNELAAIISRYGEEKFAKQIARNIEKARMQKPIETTFELVEIIKASLPQKVLNTKGHPAKKVFQAIRIEVNDELQGLKKVLDEMIPFINVNGRICVITFHSLEDRIVKEIFNSFAKADKVDKRILVMPEDIVEKPYRLVNRKPIIANEKELNENKRSHSAKLRVIERVY